MTTIYARTPLPPLGKADRDFLAAVLAGVAFGHDFSWGKFLPLVRQPFAPGWVGRLISSPPVHAVSSMKMRPLLSAVLAGLALLFAHPASAQTWNPAGGHVLTRWSKDVTPYNPLPEYPRPQMVRKDWQSLNGLWDFALTDKDAATPPTAFEGKIAVPFPYESALSGLGRPSIPDQRLWCVRHFKAPAEWKGQHVLLHFGAVNWDSDVFLNGQFIGKHRGGYEHFEFDVTDTLKLGASNDLAVSAWNPLRENVPDAQVMGKQRLHPAGIYYTAATGIWQTVWLEPVPVASVSGLKLTPDLDDSSLHVTVETAAQDSTVKVVATDNGKPVGTVEGNSNADLRLPVAKPHPWTLDDPHLYDLAVTLLHDGKPADKVASYFGLRKVAIGQDDKGHAQVLLNNKFVFERGVLDQGYWPDGLYTAPTDEALKYDLEAVKKLGFNLDRKHAKVEPERWYYWADKLGVLVWQDMPQMSTKPDQELSDAAKRQFEAEWQEIINQLRDHPSIIVWTTFNEGWGQFDTDGIVALTRQLDPTRLVNEASGWTDKGTGDFHDEHAYPGPACDPPEATRAVVNGEFGGIGLPLLGHLWREGSWGYQGFARSPWVLTGKYQDLLRAVYSLRDERGMSAFVYTQLTDVETETNGLLTYDRAVIKPEVAITAAANQGKFPALPPDPNPDLVATAQDAPVPWRYTTAFPPGGWEQTGFDDTKWTAGNAGYGHEASGVNTEWTTPDIWLRRRVTLPAKIPARLDFLTSHDEDVEIYVNGVLGASASGYTKDYVRLPMNAAARAALKPGTVNVLAVHCHQTTGGQFIDVGIAASNQ